MKKRIFSSLLLVAFTLASMSMFVSCKDYEDDINTNKDAISALQGQLSTLQTALDNAKSEASSAHATLQTAISEAKSAASEAASEAAEAKAEAAAAKEAAATAKAEAISEAIAQCKTLLEGKADKEDLDALATKVAAIEEALNQLPENIATVNDVEAAKKNLQEQIDALEYLKEILPEGTALADKLSDIEALKKAVNEAVANVDGQDVTGLKNIMQAINSKVDKLSKEVNVLQYLLDKQVTSLVLKPAYYYSGIEAIEYPTLLNYKPIIINEKVAYGKAGYQEWVYTQNEDSTVNIANIGIAQYHVNPTSANLEGYNIDFYGNVSETRAGVGIVEPVNTVADADFIKANYADGILSVPFKVPGYANWNETYGADGVLPMVALQLSKANAETASADSVITSDYGMVDVTSITRLTIANNIWKGTNFAHNTNRSGSSDGNSLGQLLNVNGHVINLFVNRVSLNGRDFTVRYDSSIDLSQYMSTHYSATSNKTTAINDREMSELVFKSLGLKYRYTAIDYTLGTNKTSESQHIKVDANTGVCTPVKVDLDGKRTDEQADKASVGRLPIVRVDLLDSNDNILAVGYVKIEITEDEDVQKVIDQKLDGTAYIDCDNNGSAATMTWAQFENNVLSALGMSRETFEKAYDMDWISYNGAYIFNQYYAADGTKAKVSMTAEEVKAATGEVHPIIGTVKYIQDWGDAKTPVFAWSFNESDLAVLQALGLVKDGKNTEDLVTYVRFTGAANVYVKLTLPAGSLQYVSGTVKNKVLAQWYKLNTKTKATSDTDAKDVHINVPVPTEETSAALTASDFTKDLQETFVDKKVKIDGINEKKFSKFVNQATLSFEFTTPSTAKGNAEFDADAYGRWTVYGESLTSKNVHTSYLLAVEENTSNGNSEIHAVEANENGTETKDYGAIVVLTPEGQITYQSSAIAKDILNYASHNDLKSKETFSAYIQISYEACYAAEIQSNSEYFNARFLRPVNLVANEKAEITDAPNGIQCVYKDNLYGLTDWRDYTLVDKYTDTQKFTGEFVVKSYYGAKVSFGAAADIYTDMNLGEGSRTAKSADDLVGIRSLAKATSISGLQFVPGTVMVKAAVEEKKDSTGKVVTPASGPEYAEVYIYTNNQANVGEFHIYVPVYLEYTWGKLTRYAVVTVKETIKQPTTATE